MSKSATDEAYDAIHEMISTRKISSGQQIVEGTIAQMLGMSRTPVREAIRRLQQDGLVEVKPNKGCFLKEITFSEMADGYEIISLLSGMACRHLTAKYNQLSQENIKTARSILDNMKNCCQTQYKREWVELDIRFHKLLIEMTGISQLITMYDHLSLWVNQVLWLVTPLLVDIGESTRDHEKLLELIRAGDQEKSFAFACAHHMKTVQIIRNVAYLNGGLPAIH